MFYKYLGYILLFVFIIRPNVFFGAAIVNDIAMVNVYENDFDDEYDDEFDDYAEEYSSKKQINDPFEKFNRKIFNFNIYMLEKFFVPAGNMFKKVTNQFIRDRISNLAITLKEPIVMANSILELDFKNTMRSIATLGTNLTIGCFGLFNPAKNMSFYREVRTFSDTFKFYGVPDGPYLILPFLGSSSIRDSVGFITGFYFDPVTFNYFNVFSDKPWIDSKEFSISLYGVNTLNTSIKLEGIYNDFVKKSFDPYILAREYYYNNK